MILIKKLLDQPAFLAGDHTWLREWLHPANDKIDLPYSIAEAGLEAGKQSLPHRLDQMEVYIFFQGSGTLIVDGEEHLVAVGTLAAVPPKATQYVGNTGTVDLKFLCLVNPPWSAGGEEVLQEN